MGKIVKIESIDSTLVTGVNDDQGLPVASFTVSLDNNECWQLRVSPDSVGNVYVWIDHRKNGQWTKLVELQNGIERSVR